MEQFDNDRENQLVEALRRGDTSAFAELFDRYWFDLYEYASKKINEPDEAEELVQNVFLDLWEKRERLVIGNVFYFLKVCLRNKCVDYLRGKILEGKYAGYCKLFSEADSNVTDNEVMLNDLSECVEAGLRELPEKSQLVFKLNKFEGFSIKEVASRVNLSEKGVEYHLTKAMKTMRRCLKDFVLLLIVMSC
jgi:RNA polymerase sigma-70 factor (family 1)